VTAAAPSVQTWSGEGVTLDEVERELARLRAADGDESPPLRTSVMTHIAWVPEEWLGKALEVLEGMAERHPSRTIILTPQPDAAEDRIDARLSVVSYPLPSLPRSLAAEVIELRLLGERAAAPESIVTPLLIADLPVFCRWRGRPDFDGPEFEQLTDVADRLIVDSREWPDVPRAYRGLARWFGHTAVSDLAWARTSGWRRAIAELWPRVAGAKTVHVAGPVADASLLAGWLRSRLGHDVRLQREEREGLESVSLDGERVHEPPEGAVSPSDLLSDELERLRRDSVYEAAAAAAG
jgi:hypothetical protein